MPLWTNGDAEILIQHPAITQDWWMANIANREFDYSAEFARFINRTGLGYLPDEANPSDKRCLTIATRKSAYGAYLVSDLGQLMPVGQEVYADVKRIYQALTLHMQQTGEKLPNPADPIFLAETNQMDRFILKGKLSPKAIKYFRIIAHLAGMTIGVTPTLSAEIVEQIAEIRLKDTEDSPTEKLLSTAFLRNRPTERYAFEKLVQYGFVDLVNLPKPDVRQRGRHPVAARITPVGRKFYQLYANQFDPQIQQERAMVAEWTMEEESRTKSNYPSITQPPNATPPS